ncbi:MAG TPA: hypothetical protein VMN58_02525 [Acidimicrobiales bacterium]|nr:hypothetical protein [Acidimicrobiales bacterium]
MAPRATLDRTARCTSCAGHLVSISLARGDGTMTMHSCSRCDTRWWQRDGEATDLTRVLGTMVDDRLTTIRGHN